MKRSVLDANVLFPADLRNTFMYLALAGAFAARWTAQIHDEWIRNVLKTRPELTRDKLERTRQLMDKHALDAIVEDYEWLIPTLELPDADDRHVLAAAIHAKAEIIVTWNLKDFPAHILEPFGIEAFNPDEFLLSIWATQHAQIIDGLKTQRASLKNPPQTPAQFLNALERQGLTQFAAALRAHEGEI